MKRSLFLALGLAGSALLAGPIESRLPDGTVLTRYEVQVSPQFYVPYPGQDPAIRRDFPTGFPLSIGSGLAFAGQDADGTLRFWGLTDRGPNGDSPDVQDAAGKVAKSKVFPVPAFTPSLVRIEIRQGTARVTGLQPLAGPKGPVTGLPLPAGQVGSTSETALSEALRPLAPGTDPQGLDTEGVVPDPAEPGALWLCDEYGPFLLKVEAATGRILAKYGPGSGLPGVLAARRPNRGFEGVACADGKVYGIVQSTLDLEQAPVPVSSAKARFLRLVEMDPRTGATHMYAYPLAAEEYAKSSDAKAGDLVALGQGRFLLLEQGADRAGAMQNRIYLVDINGATDLTGRYPGGREPEALASAQELEAAGIRMARKSLVYDLRSIGSGWVTEKAEGLTVLPDGQTLAVANDNDFGLKVAMEGTDLSGDDPAKYMLRPDGTLAFKGKPVQATYRLEHSDPSERPSRLWLIRLPRPISAYGH